MNSLKPLMIGPHQTKPRLIAEHSGVVIHGCSGLATVYTDDDVFVTDRASGSDEMFYGCASLVGGNGTAYDPGRTSEAMAHADTEDSPGYFTGIEKPEPPEVLTAFAVYSSDDDSLTFYAGEEVPEAGSVHNGKTVSDVFTGFDTATYRNEFAVPWNEPYCIMAKSVAFDESFSGTRPVSTAYWFEDFTACTEMDLTYLDTGSVTTMASMFEACNKLEELDVSGFDTSCVTDMSCMFRNCRLVGSLDVSGFDTSRVTDMRYMFRYCQAVKELDVSGWDTSRVTDMGYMFDNCSALETVYSDDDNFVTSQVASDGNMFNNCPALIGGNGTAYDASRVTSAMAHVDTEDSPGYFTGKVKEEETAEKTGFSLIVTDPEGNVLEGAGFILKGSNGDTLTFVFEDGSYVYDGEGEETIRAGSVICPEGTYTLIETEAPEGFALPGEGISLQVEGFVEVTVVNERRAGPGALPSMGRRGAGGIFALGLACCALALAFRKRNAPRSRVFPP